MLELVHIKKSYNENKVLNNVSLSFPNTGFICILGKSGCGKSTLLHCIGLLEKIDEGEILFNHRNINKFSDSKRRLLLNNKIGYVFQNYQLIMDQSALFNVELPLLIAGENSKTSKEKAIKLLDNIALKEGKEKQIVSSFSGGEKQRIAVLRAIANEPDVLLADEPTGALDSKNSARVVSLLKEYSKKHLVIFVTHNKEIAEQNADRIINLSDGKVASDITINDLGLVNNENLKITKRHHKLWIDKFIESNFKRRFKRNLISIISCFLSLTFSFLIIGFTNGANKEISRQCLKHFDLGTCKISSIKNTKIPGSKLSLVQESRLENTELISFITKNNYYTYGLNYSALVPEVPLIKFSNIIQDDFSYIPVSSFVENKNTDLLLQGDVAKDNLNQVMINKTAYEKLKTLNQNILHNHLNISFSREIVTYFDDLNTPFVKDYFVFSNDAEIVGVVDELDFLSTPKIYYSYKALDSYISNYVMNNLSNYLGSTITFKDKLDQCSNHDELSSYSHYLFLSDLNHFPKLEDFKEENISLSNDALTVKQALTSFIEATTLGTEIFLIITIVGAILILAITAFASFSQDQHQNAILYVLGANRNDVIDIYVAETMIIGIIGFILSIIVSLLISPLVNNLIFLFTGFNNMIIIPFTEWLGKKFFLPIFSFFSIMIISIASTYFPLTLSKQIPLSKELREE